MTVQDFTKFDGIKEKTATKIFKSMQEKISETSLAKIMALSTIFERGFGEKKIELIVRNCPFWASKSQEEQVKSCIMNCKGMTAKSANQFVKSIPECLEFLKELKVEYKLKMEPPKVSVDSKWNGKNIVFSGFRDEKLEKEIKENGGNVSGSVTKKTSLVLVRDFEKETTKTKKAKELGILIEKI
jgi:NAD-dependent DNA ligase